MKVGDKVMERNYEGNVGEIVAVVKVKFKVEHIAKQRTEYIVQLPNDWSFYLAEELKKVKP